MYKFKGRAPTFRLQIILCPVDKTMMGYFKAKYCSYFMNNFMSKEHSNRFLERIKKPKYEGSNINFFGKKLNE